MGESSLLLAEASVGKNAERVSHELGAREPSISTAAACVGGRSGDSPRTVQRTLLYSHDSSVITSNITQTDWWDWQASLLCSAVAQRERSTISFFRSFQRGFTSSRFTWFDQQCQLTLWKSRRHPLLPVPLQTEHTHRTNRKMPASIEK